MSPFMQVYGPIPRQGPGTAEDIAWACAAADLPPDGRVCDVGCGGGADLGPLREAVPRGEVLGLDPKLELRIDATLRYDDPSIAVRAGQGIATGGGADPVTEGPFDLIWCAGAIYFDGVGPCLTHWRAALTPGGAVAFSAPVSVPGDGEAAAFWEGSDFHTDDSLDAEIAAQGYDILARSRVAEAGWIDYYDGLLARCDRLSRVDDGDLARVIAAAREEAAAKVRLSDRVGYALRVVRPR